MLWYKGWLETRFKVLFTLDMVAFFLAVQYSTRSSSVRPNSKAGAIVLLAVLFGNGILATMTCVMLAAAGIATQPTFQASKGLHGSTLFTLSLPVSRLRLLAVRAAVGGFEGIAIIAMLCWGTWLLSPLLRATVPPAEMAEYAATLIACCSVLYFLSVLLATFLDDQWRTWGTMIAAVAIWWLSHKAWLPASIDIAQAIGKSSPLIAHTMPWAAMAFSIALAAAFSFAALKVVQTREY
jgi:hypothetical protein